MLRSILPIARNATCLTVRTYYRKKKPIDTAGVRIQHKIFKDDKLLEENPEQSYEADFNQLSETHHEYEQENELKAEQLKYFTIKNKYFKSKKQPNFLTWAEMEQIRHLNKTEPDEWTPERLSESFPAIEDVIIKVLKAKWTQSNMKRVQKHDEGVKRNWELFKSGQMKDLDPDVKEHLQKFSNRNFDNIQNAYIQTNKDQPEFQFPKPKSDEFLLMVSSCKRKNTKVENDAINGGNSNLEFEQNQRHNQALLADSKLTIQLPKNIRKRNITFDQLIESTNTGNLPNSNSSQNEEIHLSESLLKESDPITVNDKQNEKVTYTDDFKDESNADNVVDLTINHLSTSKIVEKYATKTSTLAALSMEKKFASISIQRKVQIPTELQKRGSIYRYHDCFYDHRGEFMYRVPGLKY